MLPVICVGVGSEYVHYHQQRSRVAEHLLALSSAMTETIRLELQTRIAALQVLAQSPSLTSGDLAAFHLRLDRFLALQPPGATAGLIDRNSTVLLVAGGLPGAPPPPGLRAAPAITDRVFQTGAPAVSDYYVGLHSHRPSFSVDVPVRVDGTVQYDLSLNPGLATLAGTFRNQQLPPNWLGAVLDSKGVVLARSHDAAAAIGRVATSPVLDHMVTEHSAASTFESVTIEGTPVLAAATRVEPFGWIVGVAVPLADIIAPLRNELVISLAAALGAIVVALLVANTIARTISGPILALNQFTGVSDAQAAPGFQPTGLRETDAVAASLQAEATHRLAAEAELRVLNQELEARVTDEITAREAAQLRAAQAERMQALGQLSGGIAHDFNNVLQAVMGALSIVERRCHDESEVRRFARLGLETARRGSAVTGRLLAFARHSVLRAESWDPARLLEELREVLVATLGVTIRIEVHAAGDLPALLADKTQLDTALINLATNARDAMPDGGSLILSATAETVAPDRPHRVGLAPGRYVRISVADTGVGIEPALLRRVTEPFFTTKAPGQGTGLGLSMANGFAEQSKGGFTICSTIGEGTIASLWLPEAAGAPAILRPDASADAATAAPAPHRARILLTEDQESVRNVLAAELTDIGYEVALAEDGDAALHLLATGAPVDLLISDLRMPGMDGISLIKEAQKRQPGLRAILLTGYAGSSAAFAHDAVAGSSVTVVRKPVTGPQLADHVAMLLESAAAA